MIHPLYQPASFLTITQISQAACCPRKDFYSRGLGLVPPTESIQLKFGEAIHAALPEVLTKSVDAGLEAFKKVWDPTNLEQLGDPKNCMAQAIQALDHFAKTHLGNGAPYTIIRPPKMFEVKENISEYEVPFVITIDGLPLPIIGRADGLAQLNSTGELFGLEYKTTSQLGSQFFAAFELNNQVLGYTLGIRCGLMRDDIKGMIVEGVFKGVHPNNGCQIYRVQDFLLDEWRDYAKEIGLTILAYESTENFPKHFSGCNQINMFGLPGYNCRYLPLCQVKDFEPLLKSYAQSRHVPFTIEG